MNATNRPHPPIVPMAPSMGPVSAQAVGLTVDRARQVELCKRGREALRRAQDAICEAVHRDRRQKVSGLVEHLTIDVLRGAFYELKRKGARGIDGTSWQDFEASLEPRLEELHTRVRRGTYQPLPGLRVRLPKAHGGYRPIAILAVVDKLLQAAVNALLTPIYEADFLDTSYGARPGRSQEHALEALARGLEAIDVCFILDADFRAFFDCVDHAWMIQFLEDRIGDARLIGLVQQWLAAGTVEGDEWVPTTAGLPQGGVISPLLANLYLHYTYDLWVRRWARVEAAGRLVAVRYLDDTIVGFEHPDDAERLVRELEARLARFRLTLHPGKTRLVEFARPRVGLGTEADPATATSLDFLGFTFRWELDPQTGSVRLSRRRRGT